MSTKFSRFQDAKAHSLGSTVCNISLLTFNSNENTACVVLAPLPNVSLVSAEKLVTGHSSVKFKNLHIHDDGYHMMIAHMMAIKGVAVPINLF